MNFLLFNLDYPKVRTRFIFRKRKTTNSDTKATDGTNKKKENKEHLSVHCSSLNLLIAFLTQPEHIVTKLSISRASLGYKSGDF